MDDSFGPQLLGHFDFTLLFEDTIFHIAPSVILIVTTIYFVTKIIKGKALVLAGWLLWIKLGAALALTAVQTANAVLWFQSPLDSRLCQAASILTTISALCVGIIIYANHVYFVRPPAFLGLYLTITLILDAVTTRTYFRRTGLHTLARLHILIPLLKALILFLEEVSKRPLVISRQLRHGLGSESFAGFWNTSLYLWLNRTMLSGMRGRITVNFLPGIAQEIDPVALYLDFESIWAAADKQSKYALARACFLTTPWPYIYVILPRLFFVGFKFAQPFLLQDVVNAVSLQTRENDVRTGLICATAFVYIGMAISRSWFLYIKNRIATSVRAILISAIYQKSLKLSKDQMAKEAAVTLINTDVASIMLLIDLTYESWARVLEVALGIVILALFVRTASIFSLVPTCLASIFSIYISKKLKLARKRWNDQIQSRVANTSNMLAQIKDIKMLGLAPTLATRLQKQQITETNLALTDRRAVVSTFAFSAFGESVTPVLVVAGTIYWTRAGVALSSAEFFTILALVTIISAPLANFLMGLPAWMGALGAISRIQAYLTQEEMEDTRDILLQDEPAQRSTSAVSNRRRSARIQNRQQPLSSQIAVNMTLVSVSMGKSASVLRDVTLSIPSGRTTMFTGPVGCGKSALLNAITGQAKLSTGTISTCTKRIAYCAQRPWIRNTTIRRNIIGYKDYDPVLYARIIFICALQEDFEQLPLRDLTLCGSGGCKMSGGQNARIAIARALYSGAEIIILDDPFSALDRETSSTVRIRLFGESGFLDDGRTTLIMTTSLQQHLVDANCAFRVLENGRVCPISEDDLAAPNLGPGPRVTPRVLPEEAVEKPEELQAEKEELPSVQPAADEDISDDLPATKFGDFSLYSYFISPAGIANIVLWAALVVIAAIMEKMCLIFGRIWFDKDPRSLYYFIGFALFGLINPVMNYITCYGFFYLINISAIETLHWRLADTIARATFGFLAAEDAGSILNRFSSDTTTISQRLPLSMLPAAWGALSVIIDIGVIASGASYAAPIMPVLLFGLFVLQHYYLKTSRQLRILELDTSKLLVRQVTETSTGIDHIRTFGWQEELIAELYEILEKTQRPFYFLNAAQQWLFSVLDLFSAGAGIVMVAIALYFPVSASANSMGLAFVSLINFSQTIAVFLHFFVNMEISLGAVARIRAFTTSTPMETDDADASDLPPSWPRYGRVDFNGVTAFYTSRGENGEEVEHRALDHVTIVVEPGRTLGIMGRTGSGKTSVLLALLRLVKYTGCISIDGRKIENVPLDILRTRITTITQSGISLKGSVKFNLAPFDPGCFPPNYTLTQEMQSDVLRRVGLLDLVIDRGGLDAEFSDMRLSEGQKQLFQLARAILHKRIMNSPILLIDEGTSSVDEETQSQMKRLIDEDFASCTKLIITHRWSILNKSDAVLRLQSGKGLAMKVDQATQDWRTSPER